MSRESTTGSRSLLANIKQRTPIVFILAFDNITGLLFLVTSLQPVYFLLCLSLIVCTGAK